MKVGDLVRAKHPFLVGSLGIIVQFSEFYTSGVNTGHSEICVQWLEEGSIRTWKPLHRLEVINENR